MYAWPDYTYIPYDFYSPRFVDTDMITHRESYVFDNDCKFCAQEKSSSYVSKVNTKICEDCYAWVSASVGLSNLGIEQLAS